MMWGICLLKNLVWTKKQMPLKFKKVDGHIVEKKIKTAVQWGFQIYNDTKHTAKLVATWKKDNKVSILEETIRKTLWKCV